MVRYSGTSHIDMCVLKISIIKRLKSSNGQIIPFGWINEPGSFGLIQLAERKILSTDGQK